MNDESVITFGQHKGKRLIDVPAGYLIWLYEANKCPRDLRAYIEDNLEALRKEI